MDTAQDLRAGAVLLTSDLVPIDKLLRRRMRSVDRARGDDCRVALWEETIISDTVRLI